MVDEIINKQKQSYFPSSFYFTFYTDNVHDTFVGMKFGLRIILFRLSEPSSFSFILVLIQLFFSYIFFFYLKKKILNQTYRYLWFPSYFSNKMAKMKNKIFLKWDVHIFNISAAFSSFLLLFHYCIALFIRDLNISPLVKMLSLTRRSKLQNSLSLLFVVGLRKCYNM